MPQGLSLLIGFEFCLVWTSFSDYFPRKTGARDAVRCSFLTYLEYQKLKGTYIFYIIALTVNNILLFKVGNCMVCQLDLTRL